VLRKISGFKRKNGTDVTRMSRDLVLLAKYYEDELGRAWQYEVEQSPDR
jgi:hypothetical protein